jgi:hypothetical protein
MARSPEVANHTSVSDPDPLTQAGTDTMILNGGQKRISLLGFLRKNQSVSFYVRD